MSDASSPTGGGEPPAVSDIDQHMVGDVFGPVSVDPVGEGDVETGVGVVVDRAGDRGRPITVFARDETAAGCIGLARWAELAADALVELGEYGQLHLTLVELDAMRQLNRDHMGSDRPTDVLSFPLDGIDDMSVDDDPSACRSVEVLDGPPRQLGDVVICPEVAARAAPTHAGTESDELALLTVHGVLHVVGYDHAEPDDAVTMRQQEAVLLQRFHWRGPVPAGFHHEHQNDEVER